MTSHTKGPWKIEPERRQPYSITITYSDGENRSHIAVLPQMTLCEEHGSLEANARLIAAAPELLEALKKIDRCASKHCREGTNESALWAQCASYARAAVAKVESVK